jgi:hypothetical protein
MAQLATNIHSRGWKFASGSDSLVGAGITGGFCGQGIVNGNCDVSGGNLKDIVNNIDLFVVVLNTPAAAGYTFDSYMTYAYLTLLNTSNWSHVGMQFELGVWPGGTTTANASSAHSFATDVAHTFGGYITQPLFNAYGGPQCRYTNLKIELLFGLSTGSCTIYP